MEATTLELTIVLFIYWLLGFVPVLGAMKMVKHYNYPKADVEGRKLSVFDVFVAMVAGMLSIVSGFVALIVIIVHFPIPDKIFKAFDRFGEKVSAFFNTKLF